MVWTAIIVAFVVSLVVFAGFRCRRAGALIGRILVEELGPERISCPEETPATNAPTPASDELQHTGER